MNDSIRRIINCLIASLIIAFAGITHAANSNTTIQDGKININITRQCGDNNDNATYQAGKVNISKTVQGCAKNRTKQRQASHAGTKRVRRATQQASNKPIKDVKRREPKKEVRRSSDNEGDS